MLSLQMFFSGKYSLREPKENGMLSQATGTDTQLVILAVFTLDDEWRVSNE